MKVLICSDHGGYDLKEFLIKNLNEYVIKDLGTFSKKRTNHVDYAIKLGEKVVKDNVFGIAICKSGIGMSIACNKVKGVRCAKVTSIKDAIFTRRDNDANIIALPGRMNKEKALKIVKTFLTSPFANTEPYISRVNDVIEYENK